MAAGAWDAVIRNALIFDGTGASPERADLAGFNVRRFDLPLLDREFMDCGLDLRVAGRRVIDAMVIFHRMEPRTLEAAYRKFCGGELADAHLGVWPFKFDYVTSPPAMAVAVAAQWISNYLVSWTFPILDKSSWLTENFHHGFAYWIYGVMSILAAIFVWKLVPETKGKTLEEMERLGIYSGSHG